MMGTKTRKPKLFYLLSLDELVPKDHILRKFEKILDFRFIRSSTASCYSHTGQPSIDPEVLFKMMLIGYLFGIPSERKLIREISVNLAYRWFLGYDLDEEIPHHSVLSKARKRFNVGVFHGFFSRVVTLCKEAGLIKTENAYIDSTLIQADASLNSFVPVRCTPKEYLDTLKVQSEKNTDEMQLGKRRSKSHVNDHYRSKTDPDACLISRKNISRKARYKVHVCCRWSKENYYCSTCNTGYRF